MKYFVRIDKRVKNGHVYVVLKRIGERQNLITKLFMKAFGPKAGEGANAAEKLS
jgi:hypothetical protein